MKLGSAIAWSSTFSLKYKGQFYAGHRQHRAAELRRHEALPRRRHGTFGCALWLLLLLVSLAIVCFPRFNRQDLLIPHVAGEGFCDADQYVVMTRYFRGQDVADQLEAPFTYRPLVPFVASLLPCAPQTAINLVNVLSLFLAALVLFKLLAIMGIDFKGCVTGCGLFVFSFPVFYYGTIHYIDPAFIFLVILGTYYIVNDRFLPLVLVMVCGAMVKETIVILFPVLLVHQMLARKAVSQQIAHTAIVTAAYLIAIAFTRVLSVDQGLYCWSPSLERVMENALRPRSWISALLSLGIPGLLSIVLLYWARKGRYIEELLLLGPFVAGFLTVIALFGYSLLSASADGRFIWPSYAFSIPICMVLYMRLREQKALSLVPSFKSVLRVIRPAYSS